MKPIIKNFLSVIRRFKMAVALNILGLSVAFAAFMIIMIQLNYDDSTRWLENFAYKTPMYWWVYLLAFVVVGIITAATVTFQNWRVASDNPVNAIKME